MPSALLDDLQQAVAELRGREAGIAGRVTLMAGTAFGCSVLPRALRLLAERHPAVKVQLTNANSGAITAAAGQVTWIWASARCWGLRRGCSCCRCCPQRALAQALQDTLVQPLKLHRRVRVTGAISG